MNIRDENVIRLFYGGGSSMDHTASNIKEEAEL